MNRTQTRTLGKLSDVNAIILAVVLTGASTISAFAGCSSGREIAASRAHWATLLHRPVNASDSEASCRVYAGTLYELVTLRQGTASCVGDADRDRNLAVLDSEIDAFNNLLATKCGS